MDRKQGLFLWEMYFLILPDIDLLAYYKVALPTLKTP